MRLFWKLFCSMVIITALACSLGGFILIDGQFRTGLDARAETMMTENALLRRTFLRELQFAGGADQASAVRLAEETCAQAEQRGIFFRLVGSHGQILAGSRLPAESGLAQSLGEGRHGWELLRSRERSYLHASSPMVLEDCVVYLENWCGADDLFAAREEQYHVFFYLQMGLILASALAALAVSAWISRPLGRLSAAARQMAAGELSQRVEVRGSDEISRLSRDFNQMSDQLEQQVQELTATACRQRDFLNSFAHETKTPLTSIIGYAELMLSHPDQPELVLESASCVFREGRRLENISGRLMDLIVLDQAALSTRRADHGRFSGTGSRCDAASAETAADPLLSPRRARDRGDRAGSDGVCMPEPAGQRPKGGRRGGHGLSGGDPGGERVLHPGDGQRQGDPAGGAAADHRALLHGGQIPVQSARKRRAGAGGVPADRGPSRRPDGV